MGAGGWREVLAGQKEGWILAIRKSLKHFRFYPKGRRDILRYFRRSWVGGDCDVIRFRKLSFCSKQRGLEGESSEGGRVTLWRLVPESRPGSTVVWREVEWDI